MIYGSFRIGRPKKKIRLRKERGYCVYNNYLFISHTYSHVPLQVVNMRHDNIGQHYTSILYRRESMKLKNLAFRFKSNIV